MGRTARAVVSVLTRVRLRIWALRVAVRLRAHGTSLRLEIGRAVRARDMPTVRILPRGRGGRVVIELGPRVDLGRRPLLDLGTGSEISLSLGRGTQMERAVRVQALGGRIEVGEGSELRDGATLKASSPEARLTIGDQARIGRWVGIHCHGRVELEWGVTLADRATIVDSHHEVDGSDVWTMDQPVRVEPVHIGRNSILLTGAVVLHGVTLGRNSVVAANSLLPGGTHEPGSVLVGVPARRVRRLEGPAASG